MLLTQSEISTDETAFEFKFLALPQSNCSVRCVDRKQSGTLNDTLDGERRFNQLLLCACLETHVVIRMKFAEREMRARSNAIDRWRSETC